MNLILPLILGALLIGCQATAPIWLEPNPDLAPNLGPLIEPQNPLIPVQDLGPNPGPIQDLLIGPLDLASNQDLNQAPIEPLDLALNQDLNSPADLGHCHGHKKNHEHKDFQ